MSIYIERYNGPSKLDERLEEFRDSETGHILLTSDQAKDVLLQSLIGFYRGQVGHMDTKIMALLTISGDSETDDRHNYTEKLEIARDARRAVAETSEKLKRQAGIFTPPKTKQPEI